MIRMEVGHDEPIDRLGRESDCVQSRLERLEAIWPVDTAVEQCQLVALDQIAVHPCRASEWKRYGHRVETVPERSWLRNAHVSRGRTL